MHTGVISFCDRIAFNIKSSDVKDVLLDELHAKFGIKILQRHWFPLDERNKDHIARSPHSLMLRSNGNPYYLYFTHYEDVSQMMFIDKKVHPNYEKPRIILIRGQFDERLFENTLLEGEMVKDERNQWIFLINDVIGYRNRWLENESLPQRLGRAYDLFQKMYRPDALMDVCQFHIKKIFPAIQSQWDALMELHQSLPYTNRGVYVWPHSLKYKPKLMNFDDSVIKKVIRKVKDDPMFRETLPPPPAAAAKTHTDLPQTAFLQSNPQSNASCGDETPRGKTPRGDAVKDCKLAKPETALQKVLYLRKTENPDVYHVFEEEQSKTKLGTAFISSLALSKQIRAIFKDLNVITSVSFLCRFDPKFEKWVPIKKQ
jgi:hypothetical protein